MGVVVHAAHGVQVAEGAYGSNGAVLRQEKHVSWHFEQHAQIGIDYAGVGYDHHPTAGVVCQDRLDRLDDSAAERARGFEPGQRVAEA